MPFRPTTALLPAGFHDVLPDAAEREADVVGRLMGVFATRGYQRVKAPLVEFEESLFAGSGAAMAKRSFRLMDPASQRMMAVRSDITPQIARIATTRLIHAPRPTRLCYSGEVLRVKGSQLRDARQFTQSGVELIGSLAPEADAEVILLAAGALGEIGVRQLSVDLCVPTMVPGICRALGVSQARTALLRAALDRKDAAAVAAVGGPAAALLKGMMEACGPAGRVLAALAAIDLPQAAEPDRRRLVEVVRLLGLGAPDLAVTIDLVEYRGFEYQTGLSFTLFARSGLGELGAGGRYRAGAGAGTEDEGEESGEPATGFTLYMDSVLHALAPAGERARVFVPAGTPLAEVAALRGDGWVTLAGLGAVGDPVLEARRLTCSHCWINGVATPVD